MNFKKIGLGFVLFGLVLGIGISSSASGSFEATLDSLNSQNFPFTFSNVRVTDNGIAVTDLTADNFKCSENGIVQTDFFQVTSPQTAGGVRLADIVFLIDASGSMGSAINGVKNNVNTFADALVASDVDYRLGLVQFGQYSDSGHPQLFNSGNLTDAAQFKEFVNTLRAGGEYEPGFLALRMAAQGFNFRPGAQKVFLLISDEDSDDRDKEGTITLLQTNDIVVHTAVDCAFGYSSSDYCDGTSARAATGGQSFGVQGPYSDILDSIVTQTASSYVIRYKSSNPTFDGTKRDMECAITRGADQTTVFGNYVPGSAPIITLSAQTEILNQNTLPENSPDAIIRAAVTDEVEPFAKSNGVWLYYRTSGSNSDYSSTMMILNGQYYEATIPIVSSPGVDYYLTATDGEQASSLPSTDPGVYPIQIAVLPNVMPNIAHEPVISAIKNKPITITATITDATEFLQKATLKYRRMGELLYKTIEMHNTSGDTFEAIIPADDVTDDIEYYLIAKDNFNVAAYKATADEPFVIGFESENQKPVITINESDPLELSVGENHTFKVTATDTEDGDISNKIIYGGSYDPKTTTPGNYTKTFSVTDSGGLTVTKTLQIIVKEARYEDLIMSSKVGQLDVFVAGVPYKIISSSCKINLDKKACDNDGINHNYYFDNKEHLVSDPNYYFDNKEHLVSDPKIAQKIGIIEKAREIDRNKILMTLEGLQKLEQYKGSLIELEKGLDEKKSLIDAMIDVVDAADESLVLMAEYENITSVLIEYEQTLISLGAVNGDEVSILENVRTIIVKNKESLKLNTGVSKTLFLKKVLQNLLPSGIAYAEKALIFDPMKTAQSDMEAEYVAALKNYTVALSVKEDINTYEDASTFIFNKEYGDAHGDNYLMLQGKLCNNFYLFVIKLVAGGLRDEALSDLTGGATKLKDIIKPVYEAKKVLDWTFDNSYNNILKNGHTNCDIAYFFMDNALDTLRVSHDSMTVGTNGIREEYTDCISEAGRIASVSYTAPIDYMQGNWVTKSMSWLGDILPDSTYRVSSLFVESPVEPWVTDREGRVTGIVDGNAVLEIPNSLYFDEDEGFLMLDVGEGEELRFGVKAIDNGVYGIHIFADSPDGSKLVSVDGKGIPVVLGEEHVYNIDWQALAQGEAGVTIRIDKDGDGVFERTIVSDATLEASEITASNPIISTNTGGGGGIYTATSPTDVSVAINNGNSVAENAKVNLTLSASGAVQMAISNSPDFADIGWEDFKTAKEWVLSAGVGEKTVYVKFRSANGGVSSVVSDSINLTEGKVQGAATVNILDGDIIQCQSSADPFAVYIVKTVGDKKYIRHIVSPEIFNHYDHLKWGNIIQVDSLDGYSLSSRVRISTGPNATSNAGDKVYEINGDQTKHWINMTAERFLNRGGSDAAIYSINQGELDLYGVGADVTL